MEEQKHTVVMSPGKAFEVIQTPTKGSIFFSIGSDDALYATREVQSSETGWTRLDLSTDLSPLHKVNKIKAKSFGVAQNQETLSFDLALVVSVGVTDYLYLSLGNSNADESWTRIDGFPSMQWTAVPFDDNSRDKNISIEGVYLVNLPSPGRPRGLQTCFVDILRGTPQTNSMNLLDRYYVASSGQQRWQKRTLAVDLKAGSISCCLGRPEGQPVGGIYTLGKIEHKAELSFAPAYNPFNPAIPPSPARFQVPNETTSIASALNQDGRSTLFLSSFQGISAFAPGNQKEQAIAQLLLSAPVVRQATQLQAETFGGLTAIYGVSIQGDLFYSTCPAGKELLPEMWSYPITLVSNVQRFSFFLNKTAGNNTVFAHANDRDMFQLTQDPITQDWASRAILLPATSLEDLTAFDSFNTRIYVVDGESGSAASKVDVLLMATSPIGVYVNNMYRVVNPTIPIRATTDVSGVIAVNQPTQDTVAICYTAVLASDSSNRLDIDPAHKAKQILGSINSQRDLDNARVNLSDGTTRPLIPGDVSAEDRAAAADALGQLAAVATNLPRNGAPVKLNAPDASENGA